MDMMTKVTGVTFNNEDGTSRTDIIAGMTKTDTVCLERDPYNRYDSNAVKVCVLRHGKPLQIGFLEKSLAAKLSPRMRRRETFRVSITGCGIYKGRPYCELDIEGI